MVKVTTDSGLRVLDRLAWDFDEYDTTDSFSHLHWYPATFVPQLPRVLDKRVIGARRHRPRPLLRIRYRTS